MKSLPTKTECKEYTLFLDRDGVINQPIINDYAKRPEDFQFQASAVDAVGKLVSIFRKVIVVTNQQGVHKKVMSEIDLEDVHLKMYKQVKLGNKAYFDAVYYAPYLKKKEHEWRKPNIGMIQQALSDFPDIDPTKLIVVGDSPSDMQLADNVGAIKVKISNKQFSFENQDFEFDSLIGFINHLK